MSDNCEYYINYNPTPKKDSLVVPKVSIDNLKPMDHLRINLFKHEGKNYLVIVHLALG